MQRNRANRFLLARTLAFFLCASIIMPMIIAEMPIGVALAPVQIVLSTNRTSYYDMQTVGLYSNVSSGGTLVHDGVVAIEVDWMNETSLERVPVMFRSAKGSQNINPALFNNDLEIQAVTPVKNLNYPYLPTNSFMRGTLSYFNITVENTGFTTTGIITATIFDSATTPIAAIAAYGPYIQPGATKIGIALPIHTWASAGTATIYVNIFKDVPSIYGAYPLAPEKSTSFQITARQAQDFSASQIIEGSLESSVTASSVNGIYNLSWRVPPYPVLGKYVAYAASNYTVATPSRASTSFHVVTASTPPQASFVYAPPAPYVGGLTSFDASSSFSYNGTIINYRWIWGDGSPQNSTSTPVISHKFVAQGTFIVTLNVTDSQNLWSTIQKPVPVSQLTPPTANFTSKPNPTWINRNTAFNASSSSPGWNGTGHPPIVSYSWNFGDGTTIVTTPNPVTYHQFTAIGNFTTTLTVLDSRGWTGQTSHIVQVGIRGMAPQASFTYSPSQPYNGGSTSFDASASFSYYGTIANYRWVWGDGSPQNNTSNPFIAHTFNQNGTFIVTLNVTDSQNLWATVQKPVKVLPPTPPTASFIFTPNPTWRNASTTFDASTSSPGWNGTGYPPIVNYRWNFGDGTSVVNTPNPVTYHQFTTLGNFTTNLTVIDTRGWTGQASAIVQVINITQHPDIAVLNVTLAGQYRIAPKHYEPYKGWTGNITVTVMNNGTAAQSFTVTAYYSNGTTYSLGSRLVSNLASQQKTNVTFLWNTATLKPTVTYTVTANATLLLGDTNTTNNRFDITAEVKGQADINGDGVVDISDAAILGLSWFKAVPLADPRADLNSDGFVDVSDAAMLGISWLKIY